MAFREILASFGIEVDTKAIKDGGAAIGDLKSKLMGVAGVAGFLGVATAGFEFVRGLTEQAEVIAKQSRMLGMSATELQTWQGAASLAGSSAEALSGAFKMINRSIAGGTGPAVAELAKLGVSVRDASGKLKSEGSIFEDAATAIAKMKDPLARNSAGMKIFGRQWADIEPLVRQGGAGIKALRAEVSELGVAFGDDFIEQSEKFQHDSRKLEIGWQGMKVMLANVLIPYVLQFMGVMVKLIKPVKEVLANTALMQTAMLFLSVKGVAMLTRSLLPLGGGLRALLTQALPLIVAFAAIQDFVVFMQGGDSEIGRALESLFGKGTAEKARTFINSVASDFKLFVRDLRESPQRVLDDWNLFLGLLQRDAKSTFGPILGGILGAFLNNALFTFDVLTGGWDNARSKLETMFEAFVLVAKHGATEIGLAFAAVAAGIADVFGGAWNIVVADLQGAVGKLQSIVASVPGLAKYAGDLADVGTSIGGAKVGSARGAVADSAAREDMRFSEGRVAYSPALAASTVALPPPAPNINHTTIHVPPGTPQEQLRAIARAAESGAEKGNMNTRAARAALVQGQGAG